MRSKGTAAQRNIVLMRRVFSMILSIIVVFSSGLSPGGLAVMAADSGPQSLSQEDFRTGEESPSEAVPQGGAAQGETMQGGLTQGEVRLFQSPEGEDLRTYAAKADWYLGISKMEARSRLYTEKQTTDYGGNVVTNTYENTPGGLGYPADYEFAIVSLELIKTISGGSSFAADQMMLTVNGTEYERILSDSFLTDHDYAAFPNSEILAGSKSGEVVFAVSPEDAALLAGWKAQIDAGTIGLRAGNITAVKAEVNDEDLIPVPMGGYLVDSQFQTEKELLAAYQAGSYSISAPFFVRDPYGAAPLTGIAKFKTSVEAAVVEVTVKGKAASEDIAYEIKTSGTDHEIPIFGFYPKHQNQFTLTAKNSAGGVVGSSGIIKNDQTNTSGVSGYETVNSVTRNEAYPMEQGLTLLITAHASVIDAKGDVRWFKSLLDPNTHPAYAHTVTDRGTFYFADIANGIASDPSVLYEMTWNGKIIGQYLYKAANSSEYPDAHHDMAESIDGNYILHPVNHDRANEAIVKIDKTTGAIVAKRYITEIIKKENSLEDPVRGDKYNDWAHVNTISPLTNGHYLLSLRNQHMVMEYDFENNEIIWAFSAARERHIANNPKLNGKMIDLPNVGSTDENGSSKTDWFYCQHDVEFVSEDTNANTMDITIFDNGCNGWQGKSHNSRMVHYRLDFETMKAVQIYSWGVGDASFYSDAFGSTQRLEDTGNYIGTGSSGKIVETTSKGAVVFSARCSTNQIYRCYRLKAADFMNGCVPIGTLKGKAFMYIGEETEFVKTELPKGLSSQAVVNLNGVYLHDQQLLLKGTAYRASAGAKKSVFVVADDGKNQYYAPLISNSTASTFDHTVKTAVSLSAAGLPQGRYNLGFLIDEGGVKAYKSTNYYLEKTGSLKTVTIDDAGQRELVDELIAKSKDEANSLTNPVVVVNPFGTTPLSALAAFHTAKPCTVTVTVKGKPASGEKIQADVTYTVGDDRTTDHVVPIVGLYADYENTVELGTSEGMLAVVRVKTGAVSQTYVREAEVSSTAAERSQTAEGLTFLTPAGAQTVPMAIDVNGELRWAYLCAAAAPVETRPLADGHFLIPSDRPSTEIFVTDAETVLEVDLTGRIYAEYFLDGMPHHEVIERQNGNLIFALSRRNSTAIEDYMAEVDRNTGETIRTWDFRKIMGIPEYDASYDEEKGAEFNPDAPHRANPSIVAAAGNHPYTDWFHQNSLDYDEGDPTDPSDDAIYATGRHQSCLIKINAEKAAGENPSREAIEWIYTDPSWLPQSSLDLKALVLTPREAAEVSAAGKPESAEAENAGNKSAAAGKETVAEKTVVGPAEQGFEGNADENSDEASAGGGTAAGGSERPYLYGPHAVERMDNGDLIVYDNFLYGSKTQMTQDASNLFSRAVRLRMDDKLKTFEIQWEYGAELGSENYTPFIGDVDYLGAPLQNGDEVTESHYLIDFGGIAKNAKGEACDVVAAMLGGSVSANIKEYKEGTIIWDARLQGAPGKVSSVYRAERVDLSGIPVSGLDYKEYTGIENRGMYTNTPRADEEISSTILNKAVNGVIPVTWKRLQDEGNRLIGTFTLPHVLSDTAPDSAKIKNLYVVLELVAGGTRVYKAGYVSPIPQLGVTEGYYKFEIMKDNQAAQIKLLLERNDGAWVWGNTGEVASAQMQYATGDIPVIDPVEAVPETMGAEQGNLLQGLKDFDGQERSLLFLRKGLGILEPGAVYVYTEPDTGRQTELVYSPVYEGYTALIDGAVTAETAKKRVSAVKGVVENLRVGIVGDDRNSSVSGVLRTSVKPEDIFYLYGQLVQGAFPTGDPFRVLAMDVDGDRRFTPNDITTLIHTYVFP